MNLANLMRYIIGTINQTGADAMTCATITDAINHIADILNLTIEGAQWVYENTNCPRWNDAEFADYDFLNDPTINNIPTEYV